MKSKHFKRFLIPFGIGLAMISHSHGKSLWPIYELQRLHPPHVALWRGDVHRRQVALTFDDGPDPRYTPRVMNVLDHYHVKGTFFLVGKHVKEHPELAQQIVNDGHAIGNHGWSHQDLRLLNPEQVHREIADTGDAIQSATGLRPTLFRAPYGMVTRPIMDEAKRQGYSVVQWSFSPKDWTRPSSDKIIRRVVKNTKNGSIILLHDSSPTGQENREATIAALPQLIEALRSEGFELVTISELMRPAPPKIQYAKGAAPRPSHG
ncbi:MAG: polysaccharide deacetylase family protein [Elusimicrobia bacterium]|nr:polysaccharide deacetylase family protein [Elusimicrobiota bacterium]